MAEKPVAEQDGNETTGGLTAFEQAIEHKGQVAMADDSTTTIRATFETRAAADLAVEHLVQQHGISRPDIFVQSASRENTAGSKPSGGDASHEGGARQDGAFEGEIEVSADIAADQVAAVQRSFGDAGAVRVSGK